MVVNITIRNLSSSEDEESESTNIDHIIVTAQKREESIPETLFYISALSEGTIEEIGFTDIQDLTQIAPNVRVTQVLSR